MEAKNKEIVFCEFCNEPIFSFDPRTIDLMTSNTYCNTYCLDMARKHDR